MKLKKIELNVKWILEHFPTARNSDKDLIIHYGYQLHNETNKIQYFGAMIRKMPPIESITRARRKIQAGEEFMSAKQIRKKRKEEEEKYKQYYSKKCIDSVSA